tara:strand:+ start:11730 stop:12035 length:306 start_codon:yes stop_codon:yes gene_type:complete
VDIRKKTEGSVFILDKDLTCEESRIILAVKPSIDGQKYIGQGGASYDSHNKCAWFWKRVLSRDSIESNFVDFTEFLALITGNANIIEPEPDYCPCCGQIRV